MATKSPTSSQKIPVWIFILGVALILGWWLMSTYNGLVSADASVQNSWAQVETEYQRRADLVPNLVSTVQGAADFEQSTLTAVTAARTQWMQTAQDPNASLEDQMAAGQAFDSSLSRLLVTVEAYPTLTATEGFQTLQSQLEGTENRVSVARKDFNEVATTYNVQIKHFPTNLLAGLFGFEVAPLFEADAGSETTPDVDFSFGTSNP